MVETYHSWFTHSPVEGRVCFPIWGLYIQSCYENSCKDFCVDIVVVNFMCHLASLWCPVVWSDTRLNVAVRYFLNVITFKLVVF